MVYSVPKWFLALRQARMATVGGFPSVDHMTHIYMCVYMYLFYILTITTNNIFIVEVIGKSPSTMWK